MNSNTPNEEGLSTAIKRAALYTRSATSQEPGEEYNALATQMRLCRMYCQSQGYTTNDQYIYSEIGNGTDGYNRGPQLTALLEAAKQGAFDVLVIATQNRLSRRLVYAAALIDELKQYGVDVESVDGHNVDDVTPLVQVLRGYVAESEREMMSRRIKYGKAAKKAQREQQH